MDASFGKRNEDESLTHYLERVLPTVINQVTDMTQILKELFDKTGIQTYETEFERYFKSKQFSKFRDNECLDSKMEHTMVIPLNVPTIPDYSGQTIECSCSNKGNWPHLLHSGNPVLNTQSDILVYLRKTVSDIQKQQVFDHSNLVQLIQHELKNLKCECNCEKASASINWEISPNFTQDTGKLFITDK
ncbi:hypothetical protein RuFDV_gp3 [Rudbeckia flower distortion virus]|uniref:Uncharacterized protein n=1 Tax=Rudbeckia flower distortion virus TaxID=587370 RepID=B8Y869_9VIRU|nr:hypothetical protein RuFDV_gp3 [Rudbeckia flower distortion virus]ACL36980.1 hypothetical protein [Rudbeckia flower distortion virus]